MKPSLLSAALAPAFVLGAGGCASMPPDQGFDRVQHAVAGRVEPTVRSPIDAESERVVQQRVDALLSSPLTSDSAVEIALLNSPRLRVSYAQVGIAVADLVEAGTLDNPRLSSAIGFPEGSPSVTELDFGLTFNLLRLLMMPARKEIAALRLDASSLEAADAVLRIARDARVAFVEVQAAEHLSSVLKEIAMAAEASAEFARRVHEAGNLSDLDLANEESLYEDARVQYGRALADAAAARQRLNAVLGLWGERADWSLVDRLPGLLPSEPEVSDLESLAVRQRFDLAATAKEVEALYKALGLQRKWRYVLTADFGAIAARDTDGQWVFGPLLDIELPIFNRRQADIGRLEAQLLGAESRLEALAIETRADVRRLLDRLFALRYEAEHFRSTIVPLRQRITRLTQEQYNFMLMDTFDLLAAKRAEIDAARSYLDALRDYWIVRADLERAVGGRLPGDEPSHDMRNPSSEDTEPQHHEDSHSNHEHGGD